jgi:chromosome segregation ATPase
MRYTILGFFLLFSTLNADEIQRIESIVNDIKELRSNYNRATNEIADYKIEITNLQKENTQLKEKSESNQNNEKYTLKIKSLENEILELKNQLKTKEKQTKICKLKRVSSLKTQTKVEKNQFPKLEMKEQYKLQSFEAKAFKLNKYAFIYDAIDGEVVESWEANRSFTSNLKSQNWIKITGYFVEKVWQPAEKELWIKKEDIVLKELDKE